MPRQKPHFKIRCSIQNHPKMQGLYEDDAMLAMYVRIGILAVERFADRRGDRIYLSSSDLKRITGVDSVQNALRKLSRLVSIDPSLLGERWSQAAHTRSTRTPLGLLKDGAWYVLSMPNFAQKQGFAGAKRSANGSETVHSASATATSEEEGESDALEARPTRRSKQLKLVTLKPEPKPLPPEVIAFTADFEKALVITHDGFKPPTEATRAAWLREADRMLRLDGRTLQEVRSVAAWLFTGTDDDAAFWRRNVLSLPKFRSKFERLRAQYRHQAAGGGKHGTSGASALIRWADRVLEGADE